MLEATRKLMEQIGQWDPIEETWEIFVPTPRMAVVVNSGLDARGCCEVGMEISDLFDEHGLDFDFFSFKDDTITVLGVRLAQCV